MQNWDAAMEDLTRLKETIDNNVSDFLTRSIRYLRLQKGGAEEQPANLCKRFVPAPIT